MTYDHDHHGHTRAHDHSDDGHSHGAGHVHAPASFGKAFAIGVALNAGFVFIEVAYGILGNSVALLRGRRDIISAMCWGSWSPGSASVLVQARTVRAFHLWPARLLDSQQRCSMRSFCY